MKLTNDNFLQFAMKHYDNPQCHNVEEFEEDLKRFLYIKKLLSRYSKTGELNERLILNHLITIFNCFNYNAVPMLFFKVDREEWRALATFLVFLNYFPAKGFVPGTTTPTSAISLDKQIINILRGI